ncbi:carbohydrate sulfotransferase 1-like [Acanthaster planci]|uniref:Carbohydrate sulfotransferase 1-like n=1 Tax=Acanthaster planci TaxID=133434 RepID=A0A8B7ZTG1_ACAPL|nr:carbohydrate sulfotransferase 1-like [Acanthaster planci]XP_022108709.1 carbohydrate sulfotransferase 1-like [Acanthaster planci]XP_022108710.1 carbohydrate sulfotransferase 1-like [Acanthaster planci]
MAKARRKQCLIISLLPLLGLMLLHFGTIPTKILQYGHLALSSKSILQTFRLGISSHDENVMLLKPMEDESKLLDFVLGEAIPSKIQLNYHLKGKLQAKRLTPLSPEVFSTTDSPPMVRSKTLHVPVHVGVHVPGKVASVRKEELDNSTEVSERHYFQASKPAMKSRDKHNKIPVHILIVTNRRSGSSFLGQFFNQHPNIFFQFEPLKLTEWKKEFYPDRTGYLRHLVKCEFNKTPYLVEFYNHEPLHRASSRVMTSPPLCNLTLSSQLRSEYKNMKCPPLETEPLIQACRKKHHQAIKLIRLYSISSLESVALDVGINLKIIHLVRDPRATYISKSRVPGANVTLELGKSLDIGISYLCRRINRNLDFVRSQPVWLQGKYKLVRYEDIAHDPQKLAEDIYDFTGLGQLPQEVFRWIQKNTLKSAIKPGHQKVNSYYSTSRNASQVPEAWRNQVPLKVVLRMQEICRKTLSNLGYLEVTTTKELVDKSKSLVSELDFKMN